MTGQTSSKVECLVAETDALFGLSPEEWLLRKKGFRKRSKAIQINETLLTIGNGYLNIRGSLEELHPGHCGGMYLAGVYDKSEADVEELVKCPMWTDVSVWHEEEKFCLSCSQGLEHEQVLDMKKGILHRRTTFKNTHGKILTLETSRLVFMHDEHRGYMRVRITPVNFSGKLRVLSGLNGEVFNRGFFPREQYKHLQLEKIERGRNFMYLEMKTREQGIRIAEAASWKMLGNTDRMLRWEPRIYGEKFTSEITIDASEGKSYTFEKLAVVMTNRDVPVERSANMIREAICNLRCYVRTSGPVEIKRHIEVWRNLWSRADVRIEGDAVAQQALRYNIYQLLINGPSRPGPVGAKFLSSEGYMGHVFWDTEIFILPFYIHNFPSMARNILMYRCNTLPGAIRNAEKSGYEGARFAWESATTGEDVTPRFASKLEKIIRFIYTGAEEEHIVSDVIYGVERYFRVTGDESFLLHCGLEMVFLTARYWASRVTEVGDRYEIYKVIGPDEFHEHVNNNAYTNWLVKWHLRLAAMLFKHVGKTAPEVLSELSGKIALHDDEPVRWLDISRKLKFNQDSESWLVEQFDGYFDLKDYVIGHPDRLGHPVLPPGVNYRNIGRTRLIKQADVLLMMLLFPHCFSVEEKKVNYDFYEPRTAHKSSLSHCTYAMMGLAVSERANAYRYFMKTALFDLENLHNNTELGIHAASVGGSWQTVIQGFAGLTLKSDRIVLKPWLPKKWKRLSFRVRWRERDVHLDITHREVSIRIDAVSDITLPCTLYGKTSKLRTNNAYTLQYCAAR
ncbi:MAG TPA: glycoside hydrolase family 65 protein [Chlorobaculum parvum]|uniref:Glycoside hydrolase family 65 protein n=1 Tax=Chlorobaculum parvum TaxID=274539 RepID=A0A7C5HR85_9CHLB|nr:glycoside hydrolase family 65 protein [Chlorobaculum parvum]